MARVRKVTRTMISTDVEVKTINTATDEIKSVLITVAGTYNRDDEKDAKALDKATRKAFAEQKLGDTVVFVAITDAHPVTKKYAMLEQDFIKLAECTIVGDGEVSDDDEEDDEE
jgi:hypothetical protein